MIKLFYDIIMAAVPIFLSYIVWLLKEIRKDKKAGNKGLMLLLRENMIEKHEIYTEKEKITSNQLDNYIEIFNCYTELNGNHGAEKLLEEVKELPIKNKE